MHAVMVERTGGPDVLNYTEITDPTPGPGELLVRVAAAGVNFIDTYFRSGLYPRELPYVAGEEGAGAVVAVGVGVTEIAVGDTVAWCSTHASYAELTVVPAASALLVPSGLAMPVAASALLQGMTAHYLVNSTFPIQAGQTVLAHAGAGGVGLLLIQMAKAKGATVITTVSTDAKADLARSAGADYVLGYDDEIAAAAKDLTGGQGVHAVFDGVGASTFEASLASLRVRGTLALFGAASGPVPPFDLQRLNGLGSLVVTRPSLAHHTLDRTELLWRGEEVLSDLASGALDLTVGATYALDDAVRAHTDLAARRTTGSIVLVPSGVS